ncbi:DUF4388 domain-containing protein [Actinomadura miaoliensis]|uniref:PatA-like N-terminal domain-containing protein n=1 Tax=Actinomadura miaoliensis TaxID=430685 RepID=A0ABP7V324_9ACTN
MTASPITPAGAAAGRPSGILISALRRRGQERFSGTLRLDGNPGGTVTMRDGRIVAAATPAAPGPESLLLRSGRIAEPEWSRAFAAAAPAGRLPDELVERGLLGEVGVEVLARTAVVDALFAMALTGVRTCTVEPADAGTPGPLVPVEPGLDTDRLVREITRRLEVADGWRVLDLTVRSRPRVVRAEPEQIVDPARREVLGRVNGRRTPRDIAFTLGRGLFAVMSDLATLVQDGFVSLTEPPSPPPTPPEHPVAPPEHPVAPPARPERLDSSRLPRRYRNGGASSF